MKNTKKKKSKKKISKVVFNKVAKVASLATTVVAGEMIATKNAEANVTIGSTSGSSVTPTGASLIGSGNLEGIAIGKSSKVSGAYGIAMGKDSTSVQEGAIAIGKDSNALNKSAVALGYNSKASGGQSVAIGGNIQNDRGAQATGDQSISIGGDTVASGSSSIAIGGDDLDAANRTVGSLYSSLTGAPLVGTGTDRWIQTKASGEASIAVGVQATSAGDLATAFGTKTKASGKFSTALGVGATSDGQGSIAIGGAASSVGATAIAIGTKVTTIGESASAIGYGSQANNKGSIAIGLNSKSGNTGSTEDNTIAMGTNSQSLTANSVAIGTGSIGGSTGIGSSAVAIGNGASAKGSDGIALGSGSNANNMQNIAIGYKTETGKTQVAGSSNNTDIRNVSIGSEAGKGMGGKDNLFLGTSSGQTSNGDYNVAFGSGSGKSVTGSYNTAMGANAGIGVKNNNNVSIGADSGQNTDGLGNTAIGWQSGQAVKGGQNISMGYQSAKGLKGSSNTVIGNQAGIGGVEGDNNIIVGTNATRLYTTGGSLKVQNVVSLGTNSKAYTDNSVSIGSYSEATGKAAIAIGQSSKASKDDSMAIGNRTSANTANGDVALGSGSATKAVTAVSNATITPPSSKSITYGTFAGNNPQSAVSVGTAGNERQIQNVAAGRVTKDSTDAINGSQLFAVANELGKTWKGNAGKTGSGELVGTASSTQVMPGDEVQFIAGDNLSIKQETSTGTQKYTYSLKKDVDLGPNGSLKAGPVTINNNGINAGNKTITNVSPGVNPTDAANVSQVKAAKTEVKSTDNTVTVTSSTDPTKGNTIYDLSVDAANKNLSNINNAGKGVISDIATKSINVAAGTNVKDVTSNTVTNADGTKTTTFTVNAKGANVVAGDGVTVTSSAGANNVTDYTVAVKDTTLTTNGTTVTAGNNNNFAKAGDVANAITNAANAAKTEVKSPDSSINVTADNTSPDGHTIYNITVDKTGKVAAGDTKLVTGDTVNTAINKAVSNPLTFAGDNAGGDVTRKLGEKLNIKGGATGATAANNIKVTADGTDTLNIELAKDLTGLDSIVTNGGNTTINNNGITTPTVTADKVTINNAPTTGTDATNKTYVDSTKTEVTSNDNSVVVSKSTNGNKDVYDLSVDITKLDAANKDLSNITNAGKGVINNIARNSVDVVAGTNIAGVTTSTSTNTDGTTKTTFTVDAKGANVVAGDGVTVTSAAGANNVTDYTVAVKNTSLTTSGTTVSTTDPNSYVKAGDLATAITNVGKAAKTEVKSSDNSIGVTSSAGTDGNTIYDLKVDTSGTVTPGNNKLVTGDTVNTAINNAKTDLINNNPLTFAGDSGTDVTRKLGEKLNVKGGATGATTTGNIAVKADGTDTLNIELAKDLTGLDSITTNGGTKIDNNGITINNGAGSPVTLGPTGLNNGGNPITGVGAGTNKTDAVNVGQLDDKIANSKWQLTTSKSTGTVSGTTVEDINPNEVVTIDAGKNIGITQSGNKITIDTDFTSVANAIGGGTAVDPTTGAINTTGANIGGTGKTNVSDAVAAAKTTVTSKNGSVTVSPTTDADGHTNYDLKVDTSSIAAGTNLTYKANGTNDQTTTLANGLDFNNGKNTVASVDVNGKVVYDIKDNVDLGAAGSIKAGDTTLNNGGITINNGAAGSPVTLGPSGLNNGGNKITNVAPGVNNTDAANYGQVKAAKSEVVAGTNTNVHTTTGSDGQTIYKVNADKSEVATTGTGLTLTSSSTADSDGTKTTTYTLGLDTTTLTTGTNGSVTAPSTTDAGKVVTAGDVANAINNSGFTLKSSANGGTLGASTGDEVINPGDVIDMAAGKNLKVEQAANGKITYSLSDNVDLGATGSIKAGDTTLNNGGITINNGAGSPVTLGPTGLNNGGNPITGVGAGTNKTDAVNVGQLDDKIANSKWQLTTSKSTGTVSGTTVEDINPNEVVTIDAGKNIGITQSGNKITIDTDFTSVANAIGGGTAVDPTTGAINTTGANIGGTGKTNVSDAVAAAKTTVTSKNGSVTVSPTTDADGHTNYDLKVDTSSIAAGTNLTYKANGTNDQTTTLANGLDFNNGKNTVASVDANGKVVYDIKDNIDLGTAGSVTAGNTTINNGGVTTPTLTLTNSTPITSSTGGKATVPTGNGNQAVTAQTVADAINALGNNTINLKAADGTVTGKQNLNKDGGLEFEITGSNGISTTATGNKVDVTIAQSGLTTTTSPTGAAVVTPTTGGNTYATAGDVANAIQNAVNSSGWNVVADKTGTGTTSGTVANELIKPGDTVKLQAGNNLNVDQTGGIFTYSLKDDISLNSVTTGDTKISNGGVTITNPAGSNVTLGPTGLNNGGNTITNVAPGVNNTDAANYGQVKAAKTEVQAGKNVTVTSTTGANDQTIYTVNTDFTSVANAIGGGTTVDPTTGAINTTGANIGGTGKTNVSDAVAAAKTTVTSADKSVTVVETTGTDGHSNYDLKVDTTSIAKNTNLTYKANGANNQTTTLSDGLDFNNGKNTVASVDANGKVVYDIKDNIDLGTAGSVTAGNTTINNGGVTTPTLTLTNSTPITSSTGGKATVPTGNGNQAVTAQTVADAINALGNNTINLKAADGTVTGKQNLNKDGGLEFEITGSNGISTTATGNKVDVTIAQSGLTTTTSPTGAAVVTPTTGGNTYATAGDVANAIQNAVNSSGWNVVADKTGTGTTSGTVANELIKPGDTVKLQAGNNLNVDQTGGIFTYSLKDDISLNSVTTGDTKISNGGVTITNPAGSPVTLGPSGLNNGGNTITNVGAGKNGTDAVNLDQLTKATGASKTEVAGGTNTNVTSSTGANGQTIYKVNADKSEVATTGTGLTLTPTTTTDSDGTKTTTYTLGLDTTTLTTGANGSVTAPSTADAGKVVTAGSVADAINKSGFTLKSSANGGTLGSSTGDEVINPGDVIDMAAGKNLKVEQAANGKITYSLLDDININSVTAGNNKFDKTGLTISDGVGNTTVTTPSGTTYTSASGDTTKVGPNGITITNGAVGNPVSLTKNGLDNGGNTITNVAPGVNGTDAVNVTQLKNTVNNAVNNGPVVYTNAAGDKVVKANDGNYYKASDVDANGNPLPGAVAVNPTDINHSLLNADGTTTNPSKLTNIADGLISPTSKDAINGSQLYKNATSVSNIIGGNSVVNPDGTLTTSNIGNTGKNTVHDAIGYLNQGFNVTTSASNGTVSGTSVEAVKAGETVTIDAGKNIAVTQNGKTISIATKDDLSVNSVTATDPAGNTTVLNPTGTTITDAAGNSNVSTATSNKLTDAAGNSNVATAAGNTYTSATGDITNVGSNGITITSGGTTVSLTNAGLNNGGNKITNVAAGVAPTDAVNVSQLDTAVNNLNTAIGAAKTEVVAGTNTTVTSTQGANKQTIYKIDADGTTVSGGSSFVSVTPGTKDANNITDYKVDLSQSTKDTLNSIGTGNIAAGDNNTVTGSTVHNYLQNNPLTYTDDNGTTLTRNLGQNLNVVGRATGPLTTGNIGVVASSTDTLEVKLAENVNLGPNGSVTMGNTVVNNDGVTINGGPSITSNGIDGGGKKLTNVAEGDITPTSRDVVTGGQVYNAVIAGGADKATKAELSGVNSNLTAGIAGVAAMANLPQINDAAANRFNVAVAGGAYKNGRAMALGFSGISDGGRFIYKASASLNNKNDVTVGLGMGYQFGKRDVEPNELDRLKSMVTLLEQQKDSYSRQLKKQLEEEASKNRENSELIKQLMQEVQELKNRR